jgi:hypothetical protein
VVAIIAAAAALSGALGSQFVATRAGLKTRRLELYFKAKADAYRTLLERIGEFALEPTSLPRYLAFLAAYEGAFLFASEDVAESLRGRSGLHVNAQRLRGASSDAEREKVAVTTWYEAQKQVATAMREDLKQLSGGLQ